MSNRLPTLGDRARDKVSGFEGIVTTQAQHLTGCDRLWLTPRIGDDGKSRDGMWVDIDMVEIVEAGVIERVTYERSAPGGVDLPPSR